MLIGFPVPPAGKVTSLPKVTPLPKVAVSPEKVIGEFSSPSPIVPVIYFTFN